MRLIPKSIKVKTKFYKSITMPDILLGVAILGFCALVAASNLPYKLYVICGIICCTAPLFFPVAEEKLYMNFFYFFRYLFSRKNYSVNGKGSDDISGLIPFEKIESGYILNKDGSFTAVIEIKPIEFNMLTDEKQDVIIDGVITNILCSLMSGQQLSLVKLDRPLTLFKQLSAEAERMKRLIQNYEDGVYSDNEYAVRMEILEDRLTVIDDINSGTENYSGYYFVLSDTTKNNLINTISYIKQLLSNRKIESKILDKAELEEFLKLSYDGQPFEHEVYERQYREAIIPKKLEFRLLNTITDKKSLSHFVINQYPVKVNNAWGSELFNIPNTKVVMKLKAIDKFKAVKKIDNAITELSTRNKNKASQAIDNATHIETLSDLLVKLQSDNEALFDVTLTVTAIDALGKNTNKKAVRQKLRELGFGCNEMIGRQQEAYLTSGISTYDNVKSSRGMPASSVAACFPFVSNAHIDDNGFLIGENNLPVLIDFFKRDGERLNSNMIIVGKPGSGKSYAAKTLLANLAADDCKLYILDPENEYSMLTNSLGGKVLDVSSDKFGKLNPFHIIGLDDETESGETSNNFYAHLQFLEEFFKVVFEGLNNDCFELLNKLVEETYRLKGIQADSKTALLSPASYPTFDDLALLISNKQETEQDTYTLSCLKTLSNYLSKFINGGRNSALWNGVSSFETDENVVCFDFQKLLASKNKTVANAQMLLILKWIENEIFKNREYNLKHGTNRKIILVIEEAHIFIDEKFPVALDFMYQLGKRIRKYNGMQIVITQNIKDFTGTAETAKKTMAIINVSQYSMIFSLSPDDITDLCKLYEKAGKINEYESNNIVYNPRGCAFFISSPESRTNIKITATPFVENLFTQK